MRCSAVAATTHQSEHGNEQVATRVIWWVICCQLYHPLQAVPHLSHNLKRPLVPSNLHITLNQLLHNLNLLLLLDDVVSAPWPKLLYHYILVINIVNISYSWGSPSSATYLQTSYPMEPLPPSQNLQSSWPLLQPPPPSPNLLFFSSMRNLSYPEWWGVVWVW